MVDNDYRFERSDCEGGGDGGGGGEGVGGKGKGNSSDDGGSRRMIGY